MRRAYLAIYGVAGVYDGNDLVAVRKYSPGAHKAYLIAYHREGLVLHAYTLFHRDGQWHVMGMPLDDDLKTWARLRLWFTWAPQSQLALRPSAGINVLRFATFTYSCTLINQGGSAGYLWT